MSALPRRPHGLVGWRTLPAKGRGVVALRDLPDGAEVERAPVIVVPLADLLRRPERPTVLDQYLLYWSDEPGRELAMGGGLLMFYNHSAQPNVEFRDGPEPDTMSVVTLHAVRAGEELTYDYGVAVWFTPAPPPPARQPDGDDGGEEWAERGS